MSVQTRAKFRCSGVTKSEINVWNPDTKENDRVFVYAAKFQVVTNQDSHAPGDENAIFFASTPSGEISITTMRDDLFEPGRTYYVDFSVAP